MKKDDIIRWITDDGKEHLGQVISIDDKRVKFKTESGAMDVLLDDGKFEVLPEKEAKDVVIETKPPAPRKTKRAKKTPAKGTKTEQALRVFKSMKGATRQQVIKAFIDQVGLTPAGANTYYTNCKKACEP